MDEDGALFDLEDSLGISSMGFDRDGSEQHSARVASRIGSGLRSPHLDLMIATSDTVAGDYGFILGPGSEANDRFFDDVDFEFDADGEMRDLPMPPSERDSIAGGGASVGPSRKIGAGSIGRGSRMGSEEAAAQVLREHEEGRDGSYGGGLGVISSFHMYFLDPKTNFTSSKMTKIYMRPQKTMDSTSPTVLRLSWTTQRGCHRWLWGLGRLPRIIKLKTGITHLLSEDVAPAPPHS